MEFKACLCVVALSLFGIWNSQNLVQAEIQPTTDNYLLRDSFVCDYTHMETQLQSLKTGQEYLKLRMDAVKHQLEKQNHVLSSLERKLNILPQQLQTMQNELMQDNKFILEESREYLQKQIQNQAPAWQTIDDKLFILADIKEMLKNADKVLDNIVSNQNVSQKILEEAQWERHTQTLENNISKKLAPLNEIKGQLKTIENSSVTKTEQLKFYRDVQRHLNKNVASKICYKGENQNLLCTSQSYPTSCADFVESHCADNKCRISNHLYGPSSFLVSCNDHEEGGGWTVIQRRINGSVDFYRDWSEYKNGFGAIEGEFFIGLDKLHALTATLKPLELLIQMEDFNNTLKYAKYDDFQLGNETENYKLIKLGSYSGNAGDSLSLHVGQGFSTKDRDNDADDTANCATDKTGAWWYKSCMWSNLNGKYYKDGTAIPKSERGICWSDFHGYNYSLKFVQMMVRPSRL